MKRGRCSTRTLGAALALLVAALGPIGCQGIPGIEGPDPLTGGPAIQKRTSPASGLAAGLGQSGASNSSVGMLPPVPVPSTATSPAALAAGVSQPLDNSHDLRIGSPTAPATTAPAGAQLTSLPAPSPSSTEFAREQPLWQQNQSNPPPTAGPASNVVLTSGGGRTETFEQVQQLLAQRRVTWQRLELVGDNGDWRFQCSIPNPEKKDAERFYDATANSALAAMRKALDQMALELK